MQRQDAKQNRSHGGETVAADHGGAGIHASSAVAAKAARALAALTPKTASAGEVAISAAPAIWGLSVALPSAGVRYGEAPLLPLG